ncbi:uncharacterized protein ACOB8E_019070 isoform 2-T2 [Sarcophilus harrisii]
MIEVGRIMKPGVFEALANPQGRQANSGDPPVTGTYNRPLFSQQLASPGALLSCCYTSSTWLSPPFLHPSKMSHKGWDCGFHLKYIVRFSTEKMEENLKRDEKIWKSHHAGIHSF